MLTVGCFCCFLVQKERRGHFAQVQKRELQTGYQTDLVYLHANSASESPAKSLPSDSSAGERAMERPNGNANQSDGVQLSPLGPILTFAA